MTKKTKNAKRQPAATYIVSYPKSGRTWLRVMLGKALCGHYGLDERHLLRTLSLALAAGLDPIVFTHDGSALADGKHWSELPAGKSDYKEDRVVLLLRDPKDVIVSSYFQATRRLRVFDGTLSQFVRSERFGIRKVLAFLEGWHAGRDSPRQFLLLRYEDMIGDAQHALAAVLDFAGAGEIPRSTVAGAVKFARFENMRKLEREGSFESDVLRPADPGDPESFKVRRGEVGGHARYLTKDDVRYIDSIVGAAGRLFDRPVGPTADSRGAFQPSGPRAADSGPGFS